MFTFVSGNLTLDFIGTVKSRRAVFEDTLRTPADLGDWFVAAGLLDRAPAADADMLRRAKDLREAAYRLILASFAVRADDPRQGAQRGGSDPLPEADRRLINKLARSPLPDIDLRPDGTVRRTGDSDQALAEIARTTTELLATATTSRVKECGREDCTRLYLDTSRAGSRRWCDMTICGNRSKSAAFRARQG